MKLLLDIAHDEDWTSFEYWNVDDFSRLDNNWISFYAGCVLSAIAKPLIFIGCFFAIAKKL